MTPHECKAIRLQLGLSQQALADALGVHRNTVGRYEAVDQRYAIPEPVARLLTLLLAHGQGMSDGHAD